MCNLVIFLKYWVWTKDVFTELYIPPLLLKISKNDLACTPRLRHVYRDLHINK